MESDAPKRCPSGDDGGRLILCATLYTIPPKNARAFSKICKIFFENFIFDRYLTALWGFAGTDMKVCSRSPPQKKCKSTDFAQKRAHCPDSILGDILPFFQNPLDSRRDLCYNKVKMHFWRGL